jgi:hypothetical protein
MSVLRVLLLFAAACSSRGPSERAPAVADRRGDDARTTSFLCFRKPYDGGWRECVVQTDNCDLNGGCFERVEAYCFLASSRSVCSPSEQECDMWRGYWPDPSRCVQMKADEYTDG